MKEIKASEKAGYKKAIGQVGSFDIPEDPKVKAQAQKEIGVDMFECPNPSTFVGFVDKNGLTEDLDGYRKALKLHEDALKKHGFKK